MSPIILFQWISSILFFYILQLLFGISALFIFPVTATCIVCYQKCKTVIVRVIIISIIIGSIMGVLAALRVEFSTFGTQETPSYGKIDSFIFDANDAGAKINSSMSRVTSSNAAAFFTALITGRRDYLPYALRDIVRKSGISHLLALSGFHLSVLLFLMATFQVFMPKKIFNFLSVLGVWVYCLWIGFIPSLWRAGIMYSTTILGIFLVGKGKFSVSWGIAGITMVLFSPSTLLKPGFVLSMLALAGVVWGGKYYSKALDFYTDKGLALLPDALVNKKCKKIIKKILEYISVPLAISMGAAVTTAWYSMIVFGTSYPIGIAVSVMLTPIVVLFMASGIVLLCLLFLFNITFLTNIVSFLNFIVGGIMQILMKIIRITTAYASGMLDISSWSVLVVFYSILIAVCIPYFYVQHVAKIKK